MSLRSQGPSTAPEKQGWQSWLLADALYFGSDAVQEAGNGQDIEQGFPASARVVRDLEEAEVVKKRRTGTPFRKRLQQTILFREMADRWGFGRRRPKPHPCSVFLRAINAVNSTPAEARSGACSYNTRPKVGQVKTAVAAPLRLPHDWVACRQILDAVEKGAAASVRTGQAAVIH